MISASPDGWIRVPGGSSIRSCNCVTWALTGPSSCPSARFALTVVWNWRSYRPISVAPADSFTSATAPSGTCPDDEFTRRFCTTIRSARASGFRRTTMGICSSPALNLARFDSTSPSVATRSVVAMSLADTPSCAATSARGVIWISGRCRLAVVETLSSEGNSDIAAASRSAASAAPSSVVPRTLMVRSFWPFSFWKLIRISGVSDRRFFNSSSSTNWDRSRASFLP